MPRRRMGKSPSASLNKRNTPPPVDYKYLTYVPESLVALRPRDGLTYPHEEHMIDISFADFISFNFMVPKTINKQRDIFLHSNNRA